MKKRGCLGGLEMSTQINPSMRILYIFQKVPSGVWPPLSSSVSRDDPAAPLLGPVLHIPTSALFQPDKSPTATNQVRNFFHLMNKWLEETEYILNIEPLSDV